MNAVPSKSPTVIVIGAGASGLAVAYALKRRGITVQVLDKAAQVAEPWRRRHPQLRLNTHRRLSGLDGLPVPRAAGPFPARDAVVRYLEDYAKYVGVPLRLGVAVQRVEPGPAGWRVETANGVLRADHVVISTGRDRVPHVPRWPGRDAFTGEILHAADFGDVSRYRCRRILVVGAGNSGTDVLNHLAGIEAAHVWVSVRHGPVVFPTRLFGLPVQLLSPVLERLPVPVVDGALSLTERIAFGDLSEWGLRKHASGGATRLLGDGTAPAIDNGFIRSLKAGRAEIVAAVRAFDRESVRLDDGRAIHPDVVICATGYRTGLEPMVGHLGVLDERGVPAIDGAEQDHRYPGLWFAGMRPQLIGMFLVARRNAQRIADAVAASARSGEAAGGLDNAALVGMDRAS